MNDAVPARMLNVHLQTFAADLIKELRLAGVDAASLVDRFEEDGMASLRERWSADLSPRHAAEAEKLIRSCAAGLRFRANL